MRKSPLIAFLFLSLLTSIARSDSLRLIGRATIPLDFPVGKTKLGGLSGISYDPATRSCWAVSDDSAGKGGPPRVYQIDLPLSGSPDLRPKILRSLLLRDDQGQPFPVADCEGIVSTGKGAFWVISEGRAGEKGALPWIRLFSQTTGRTLRNLAVPSVYLPANSARQPVPIADPSQSSGVLSNKSLESCALSPDRKIVYTANETSLLQEKSLGEGAGGAGLLNSTQVRISALDAQSGRCLAQRLYISDAGCLFGSISDLTALDSSGQLLVLERRVIRVAEGTGSCSVRIYRVDFRQPDATDVREISSVTDQNILTLKKALVYDSRAANINDLDNVEGMTLVPLPGGRRGLLAVSDNNFNKVQQTQLLLFEYQTP